MQQPAAGAGTVAGAPYRADHVGSLLRPEPVKAARRARFGDGTVPAEVLRDIEDDAIRSAVARQEAIGLKAVTDGEFRRSWWHYDFMGALDGFELARQKVASKVLILPNA